MIWARLKENKCPTCGNNLVPHDSEYLRCDKCTFSISVVKAKSIIQSMITREPYKPYRPKDENPEY